MIKIGVWFLTLCVMCEASVLYYDGQIHILIDHPVQVAFVENYVKTTPDKVSFSVFLKLDTGYHRAGIMCDDRGVDLAVQILQSSHLDLKGVYSHWYVVWHLPHVIWLSMVNLASCPAFQWSCIR